MSGSGGEYDGSGGGYPPKKSTPGGNSSYCVFYMFVFILSLCKFNYYYIFLTTYRHIQ